MKSVCVLIRDPSLHYEGLRTSLGLLLEDVAVKMVLLDHEVADMNEAYSDNLGFFEEMGGDYISNHEKNVTKYGFRYVGLDHIGAVLRSADLIIPF